jgi:hypothetical protein
MNGRFAPRAVDHEFPLSRIQIASVLQQHGRDQATRKTGRRGNTIEALTGAVMGAIAMAAVGFLLQRKAAKE